MTDLENILPLWHELESGGSRLRSGHGGGGGRSQLPQAGCAHADCTGWQARRHSERWMPRSGSRKTRMVAHGMGRGWSAIRRRRRWRYALRFRLRRRCLYPAGAPSTAAHCSMHSRQPFMRACRWRSQRFSMAPRSRNEYSLDRSNGHRSTAAQSKDFILGLQHLAELALDRCNRSTRVAIDGIQTRVWVDYRAARPGLWIFGAGDDAKPLLRLARELGWFAAVADGRSHLATRDRFPAADKVLAFPRNLPRISSPSAPANRCGRADDPQL